jgi:hypothetical protein
MPVSKTKGGKSHTKGTVKELQLVHSKMNMWEWKYNDGGQVPAALLGQWNNKAQAIVAKDAYLRSRPVPKNGQSTNNQAV